MDIIRVDHREHADHLLAILRQTYGFEVRCVQLEHGDYRFGARTVVERKTVRDFALSVMDGRLFRQAYSLANSAWWPIVLIEGHSLFDTDLTVDPDALRGALLTLAQTYALPVVRSFNQRDSAWVIARLYRQQERIGLRRPVRRGGVPRRLSTAKLRFLQGLPGIGPHLARQLLEHFGSVESVMCADRGKLEHVPGIGRRRAARIRTLLSDEPGTHVTDDNPRAATAITPARAP